MTVTRAGRRLTENHLFGGPPGGVHGQPMADIVLKSASSRAFVCHAACAAGVHDTAGTASMTISAVGTRGRKISSRMLMKSVSQ
ncbi:MAG: hypothetical protein ABSC06_05260 [Rhodopila sp.]